MLIGAAVLDGLPTEYRDMALKAGLVLEVLVVSNNARIGVGVRILGEGMRAQFDVERSNYPIAALPHGEGRYSVTNMIELENLSEALLPYEVASTVATKALTASRQPPARMERARHQSRGAVVDQGGGGGKLRLPNLQSIPFYAS